MRVYFPNPSVGISSRLILIVDFEGFRFSKVYKRFEV